MRKRGLPLSANVNVTSLVDVAFTLLVIFIITAPILQGGIEVQLPKAPAAPITSSEGVIVTLTRDGRIYVGNVPAASLDDFRRVFPDYVRSKNVKSAYVKADRNVPYGDVLQVIGVMKQLDVTGVGLVADPELERR